VDRRFSTEECEKDDWRSLVERLRDSGQDAGLDDLLDALALALTAQASEDELQRLPDYDTTDNEFPMQMAYRRGTPFEY
jgi:predicted RNase H-like nuclease